MRMLLGGFKLLEAVTETEPAIDPIVTEYSDKTIPVLTVVMLVICALLLVVVAVVSFTMIAKRVRNWGFGMIVGFAAYLLFCYLMSMLFMVAINCIPGVAAYFEKNLRLYNLIMLCFSLSLEVLAVLFGMKYFQSSSEKRGLVPEFGGAVIFGWAFYVGAIVISKQLSYSFQYVMLCMSINQMGFDSAVTTMVQGGIDQETAVSSLLALTDQNPLEYLMDSILFMVKALMQISASVLVYGVYYGKLEKKFLWTVVATLGFYFIPSLISVFAELPPFVIFITGTAIGFAVTFNAYKIVQKYMPDEWAGFLKIKERPSGGRGGRGKNTPQKMPRIVMPKD